MRYKSTCWLKRCSQHSRPFGWSIFAVLSDFICETNQLRYRSFEHFFQTLQIDLGCPRYSCLILLQYALWCPFVCKHCTSPKNIGVAPLVYELVQEWGRRWPSASSSSLKVGPSRPLMLQVMAPQWAAHMVQSTALRSHTLMLLASSKSKRAPALYKVSNNQWDACVIGVSVAWLQPDWCDVCLFDSNWIALDGFELRWQCMLIELNWEVSELNCIWIVFQLNVVRSDSPTTAHLFLSIHTEASGRWNSAHWWNNWSRTCHQQWTRDDQRDSPVQGRWQRPQPLYSYLIFPIFDVYALIIESGFSVPIWVGSEVLVATDLLLQSMISQLFCKQLSEVYLLGLGIQIL